MSLHLTLTCAMICVFNCSILAQKKADRFQTIVYPERYDSQIGYLQSLHSDSIGMLMGTELNFQQPQKIFRTEKLFKVKVRKNNGMAIGALIGFTAGAITGALIGKAAESDCDPQCGGVVPGTIIGLSALAGGMIGVGVGVAFGSSKLKIKPRGPFSQAQLSKLQPYIVTRPTNK